LFTRIFTQRWLFLFGYSSFEEFAGITNPEILPITSPAIIWQRNLFIVFKAQDIINSYSLMSTAKNNDV